MKRIFGLMLAVAMVLSMNISAYATNEVSIDEEEMLQAISALDESFQNEDGCMYGVQNHRNYYAKGPSSTTEGINSRY